MHVDTPTQSCETTAYNAANAGTRTGLYDDGDAGLPACQFHETKKAKNFLERRTEENQKFRNSENKCARSQLRKRYFYIVHST